jgi:hypothetical protein
MNLLLLLAIVIAFNNCVRGISSTGQRVVIVVDPANEEKYKTSYSVFWKLLEGTPLTSTIQK